jgi:hypothetical protein
MDMIAMMASPEAEPHRDDVRQAAAAALADVDALGVAAEDRSTVLKALLQARLGGFAPNVPNPKVEDGQIQDLSNLGGTPEVIQPGDVLSKIAAGLKVDRDALELIYALQEGEPHVVVSAKKISTNKALAVRQLGQLIAAARQIAALEEWTSAATIRKVVQDYGRLDSANFAASIQQMDNVAVIRGKGQQREVKITKPGLEATAELIKGITGTDS